MAGYDDFSSPIASATDISPSGAAPQSVDPYDAISTKAPSAPAPDWRAKQRAIDAQADPDMLRQQDAASDHTTGIARSVSQGALFGFGDEATAEARHLIHGEDYDAALADERARLSAYRVAHPYISYGTEIGTGLLAPTGVAGDLLKGGVTAGKLLKTGLVSGGIPGAVYGYGSGEGGVANRAVNAAESGAIGTAVGAAAPLAVHGVKRAASAFTDALGNVINPGAAARRAIVDAADQSGLPLDQIATHMGAGPDNSAVPFNLVDAAKAAADAQKRPGAAIPFTNLARNAGGHGGEAEAAASEALQGRQMNQGDRLTGALDQATGGKDYEDEINRLQGVVENDAQKAYADAHANAQPYKIKGALKGFSQKYRDLLKTDSDLGQGMRDALSMFKLRGNNEAAPGAMNVPKPGEPVDWQNLFQQATDIEAGKAPEAKLIQTLPQYMAVRQSLDQMIQKSMKAGDVATPLTRKLTELRGVVDQTVKATNPGLRQADRLYSGAMNGQDILNSGASAVMRSGDQQRQFLQRFQQMTPAQKDLARIGVMQKMKDQVANLMTGSVSTARQFDKESLRQFLTQILPPDRARTLLSEINREATSTRTMSDVFGNSRTAPMQEGMARLAEDAGIAGHAATLNAPGVIRGIGAKLGRQFVGQKNNALMETLMSTDPQATQNAMRQLQQDVQARIRGARQYQAVMSALIGASARSAVQEKPKTD